MAILAMANRVIMMSPNVPSNRRCASGALVAQRPR